MTFKLASKVTKVARNGAAQQITIEPAAGGEATTIEADVVLVAIGRTPYTDGLGLEAAGVQARQSQARGRRCALPDQCPRHLRDR